MARRDLPLWAARKSYVYFILVVSGDPFVKIGVAFNPVARLAELQVANPYELRLLGVIQGGYALEEEIHKDLKADRIRGEWYEVTERTDKWLVQLRTWEEERRRARDAARELGKMWGRGGRRREPT